MNSTSSLNIPYPNLSTTQLPFDSVELNDINTKQVVEGIVSILQKAPNTLDYRYTYSQKNEKKELDIAFRKNNDTVDYYKNNGVLAAQFIPMINPSTTLDDGIIHINLTTSIKTDSSIYPYYEYIKNTLFPIVEKITHGGITLTQTENAQPFHLNVSDKIDEKYFDKYKAVGYYLSRNQTIYFNPLFCDNFYSKIYATHEFAHFLGFEHPFEDIRIAWAYSYDYKTTQDIEVEVIKPKQATKYTINSITSYCYLDNLFYGISAYRYLLTQDNVPEEKKQIIKEFIEYFEDALEAGFTPINILTLETYYSKKEAPRKAHELIEKIGLDWFIFEKGHNPKEVIHSKTGIAMNDQILKAFDTNKATPNETKFSSVFVDNCNSEQRQFIVKKNLKLFCKEKIAQLMDFLKSSIIFFPIYIVLHIILTTFAIIFKLMNTIYGIHLLIKNKGDEKTLQS